MKEEVRNTCDLILSNRNAIKKCMFWELDTNTYALMSAVITVAKGAEADPERYKECKKILHRHAGIFSRLRGTAQPVIVTKMMMADDPEAYAEGVLAVYKKLRAIHKFTASAYMVMAAMTIYEHGGLKGADTGIIELEELFKGVQAKHPFMTGDADRGYFAMLAVSGLDVEKTVDNIEASLTVCKKVSIDSSVTHRLSLILGLSEASPEKKYEFVMNILNGLKSNKTPISKSRGITAVGALALLDMPEEELVRDIADASEYLKGKRGFRWYNMGTRMRTVYAALAVFMTHARENEAIGSMISSNIAVNIAEEIIMLITVSAMTTAVLNHSSSSGNS